MLLYVQVGGGAGAAASPPVVVRAEEPPSEPPLANGHPGGQGEGEDQPQVGTQASIQLSLLKNINLISNLKGGRTQIPCSLPWPLF